MKKVSIRSGLGMRLLGLRSLALGTGVAVSVGVAGVFAVHYERLPPTDASTHPVASPKRPVSNMVGPRGTLKPRPVSYLGVYEPAVPRSYAGVASFAAATGQHVSLALYYSSFGEPFEDAFASHAWAHGAAPLVQIDPRREPLSAIAAGRYDSYLYSFAYQVRSFGGPVVIGFGHEMNGDWYPWGYKHISPDVFVAAWRHIVDVFRAEGADNVTWLWTVNVTYGPHPHAGGNIDAISPWWPGSKYVTWVGIDGYYRFASQRFATLFGPTIAAIRKLTRKPILLAEAGVSPAAGKAAKIRNLFAGIRRNHLLGLVWFDAKGKQDWRLETDPAALAAFRKAATGYPEAKR